MIFKEFPIIESNLKSICSCSTDPYTKIRTTLSEILSAYVRQHHSSDQDIIDTTYNLLSDSEVEVKLSSLKIIDALIEINDYDFLFNNLSLHFSLILHDKNFRVRIYAVEKIISFSYKVNYEFFSKYLLDVFLRFLADSALPIRKLAISSLRHFVEIFTPEQTESTILKLLLEFRDENHLNKIQTYFASVDSFSDLLSEQRFLTYVYKPAVRALENVEMTGFDVVGIMAVDVLRKAVDKMKPFQKNVEVKKTLQKYAKDTTRPTLMRKCEEFIEQVYPHSK